MRSLKHKPLSQSLWLAIPFILFSPFVTAATLTYGPLTTTGIPTLSGTMLLLLSLLLAFVGYRMLTLKTNDATKMMVVATIGIGAITSGLGGVKLINDAYASALEVVLTDPNGGTVDLTGFNFNNILNATGVEVEIINVAPEGNCPSYPTGNEGECVSGLILADNGRCDIDCGSQQPD